MSVIEHDPVASAAQVARLDGLSALRAMMAGELPPPPFGVLLPSRSTTAAWSSL